MCGEGERTLCCFVFFFFNDTATTEIYTLSLHDALPIYAAPRKKNQQVRSSQHVRVNGYPTPFRVSPADSPANIDRKSTRLNSSHANISYAAFCLKKKNYHLHATSSSVSPPASSLSSHHL